MNNSAKLIGLILVIGGLTLIGLIYGPIINQEIQYQTLTKTAPDSNEEIIPQNVDFGLVIPKIGVNTQVFAEVDADNPDEYLPLLTQGVVHAKGSVLPGNDGHVFIFAHSADSPLNITRYNAVFYLINKLEQGDEVFVYYQGQKYVYQVVEKKIIPPELMPDYARPSGERKLVLQTCHPPGTTLNRLLVIAKETY